MRVLQPPSSAACHRSCLCRNYLPRSAGQLRPHATRATAEKVEAGGTVKLQLNEATVSLPLTFKSAAKLNDAMQELMETFAAKQKAERPRRWPMMEFRCTDKEQGVEMLEVFCNPNAHPSAFDAKGLVTIQTGQGLRIQAEARLSALKSDVDTFLADRSSA